MPLMETLMAIGITIPALQQVAKLDGGREIQDKYTLYPLQ